MTRVVRDFLRRHRARFVPAPLLIRLAAWRNYRRGEPEIRLVRDLARPDADSIDVGAYEGAYTYFLRRHSRHVHAFEPQPGPAAFLRRAFPSGVTVTEGGASGHDGALELHVPAAAHGRGSQAAHFGAREAVDGADSGDPAADGVAVPVYALDGRGYDRVGLIKIDAEGHEEQVIDGARAIIARDRPVLIVEIEARHLGHAIDRLFAKITGLGYSGWFLLDGTLRPLADFSPERHQQPGRRPYINNFVFLPEGHPLARLADEQVDGA